MFVASRRASAHNCTLFSLPAHSSIHPSIHPSLLRCVATEREREREREREMELEGALVELRESYGSGRTRSVAWRKTQLKGILRILHEQEEEACSALKEDLGKHHNEAFRDELGVLIKSANFALQNLKKWMAPAKVDLPLPAFPSSGEVVPEPLGVVLIFSSWNFPIGLSLEPLIGAISAGNACVLKPSEFSPASSKFLAASVAKYLDDRAVKVITGDAQVGQQLLEHKWDKIFFTGSPRVGRIIMAAASKHLTPVVLELGGKCPAIFDSRLSSRDREMAAARLVAAKWGACCGQVCIAVDYVIVEEEFAPALIELLEATIRKFFVRSEEMSRIVNNQQFQRLCRFMNDPSVAATVVHGGAQDPEKLCIEPTILLDPPVDAEVMTEEIFGPLLPVITVKKIEDSIKFISSRPKPLVIYAFTRQEKFKKRIIEETSSGSLTFNDTLVQYLIDTLPFGGVGQSGFGQYHGKYSFDVFSHKKAVLRRNYLVDFDFRYPPWNDNKLGFMKHLYHFDYVALVLFVLGLKK